MKSPIFSKRELAWLLVFALAGLISYLSGLDYSLAEAISHRPAHGISLFFSYQYFIAFEVLAVGVLFFRSRRAASVLVISTLLVFMMQAAFTDFAPRARPPQAMAVGDGLMQFIRGSGASSSFFSGHTASSVAAYTVFALEAYNPLVLFALVFPIILSRITLVQHYLSDVFGGIIFGYVTAKLVYAAASRKQPDAK